MWDSQIHVVLVSGDDGPYWEVKVVPVAHYEGCPSGQVLDDERTVALEGFDAGFERVNARAVCFDACHECRFPSLLEVRARTVTRVGVVQVVCVFEGEEI